MQRLAVYQAESEPVRRLPTPTLPPPTLPPTQEEEEEHLSWISSAVLLLLALVRGDEGGPCQAGWDGGSSQATPTSAALSPA